MRQIANGRALLLWPPVAVVAMVCLGLAVGRRSTPLDVWFHRLDDTPAQWLLFFTDPWMLALTLVCAAAVALYLRRRRLAWVMLASPLIGIGLANLLKHLFGGKAGAPWPIRAATRPRR